jgi:prophage antirepressor-like protein
MSACQVLAFEQYKIRQLRRGDILWFVLADVCAVLEIANARDTATRVDDDERDVAITDTPGGPQHVLIVSESGLYKIARTSRKPIAKRFVRWVDHEVLPAIRRTGRYVAPSADGPQELDQLLDQKLAPINSKLDHFETKLDNILELNARRTEPIAEHKRVHVKVIKHFNFGCCPCGDKDCRRIILGDDGQLGKRGVDWEYHHQINRSSSGLKETIPLAKDCHKRITTSSEERNKFGAIGFLRWIENIERMQQRPPERIATQQNDIEFFKKAKQGEFDLGGS